MADLAVKKEEDADSPVALEDAYEEVDDLEFYEPSNENERLYIARVPAYLWQVLSQSASEDAEVRIGTIRQFVQPTAQNEVRLRLLLANDRAEYQGIPKEYELAVTGQDVNNTFIFSEGDRPEYAAKNRQRAELIAQGVPAHLLRRESEKKPEGQEETSYNRRGRRGRWREPFRPRGVQKKTKVVGRVKHELNCHPVENPESRHILELRAKQQLEPRKQLQILESTNGILLAGTNEANSRFDGFVKSAANPNNRREEKAKRLENKTARMPENELLDLINRAFTEFRYWSMRALKARIPQPEAYLRSTLEKVAILHKSGRFANTWSIRPEYEGMLNNEAAAEAAPDVGGEGADADVADDDEEDIKMEDVSFDA